MVALEFVVEVNAVGGAIYGLVGASSIGDAEPRSR